MFKLKKKYTKNIFIINGGFLDINSYNKYYKKIDGIMIGREAYKNPWIFYNKKDLSLEKKISITLNYIKKINRLFKNKKFNNGSLYHIQNIFNGHFGAKRWREAVNISINNNDLQHIVNFIKYSKFEEKVDG